MTVDGSRPGVARSGADMIARLARYLPLTAAVLAVRLAGCGGPECTTGFEPDFPASGYGKSPVDQPVHVPVPPMESYWWLQQANIHLDPDMKPVVEDYGSGYPAFLKALKRVLVDADLALQGDSTPVKEVFLRYYDISGGDPARPQLSTSDMDLDLLRQAILAAWQEANPGSGLDDFQQIVVPATYEKPGP